MRQDRNLGYQQIAAAELGLDQVLCIVAADRCELLAQPVDDDIDRAVADSVLRTVKQLPDFAARADRPGLGDKMREQTALRARQIGARTVFAGEKIAARIKPHSGKSVVLWRAARPGSAPAPYPDNLLYCFIEADNVDRRGNTPCSAGNPVLVLQRALRVAHYEDWNVGPAADFEDRVDAVGCATEIEHDDVGFAAAKKVEKAGLDRSGVGRSGIGILRRSGDR